MEAINGMGVQAIILAAGRGSRMGPSTGATPKPLLEVGRRTLIEHMLETLSDAGVGPVAMVVGYCAHEIQEVVGIRAEYIHNTRWASTNSLYSFAKAREWIDGPVMILNCDLLLHPEIIDRLLAAGEDSLAYDASCGKGREQMAIKLRDGYLQDLSKDFTENVDGENVGALYLSSATTQALLDECDKILAGDAEKGWLGVALKEVARNHAIRGVDIAGLAWAEIDFPFDLERARKEVWPTLQREGKRRTRASRLIRLIIVLLAAGLIVPYFVKGIFPAPAPDWDTVDVEDGKTIKIMMGERKQKWWVIDEGDTVTAEVAGPDTIRIDSRLVLATNANSSNMLYVIEVAVDGQREDWFKKKTTVSKKAAYKTWVIGKRERIALTIPDGVHQIGVRLIAAEGRKCLIRIRQVETSDE
jgi:choline kinase